MNITLQRQPSYKGTTFGELLIDGDWFCHTLEDQIREIPGVDLAVWKLKAITAIPSGIYHVTLEDSPKFGPETLTLADVPGFSKIRIHGGNTNADTEGCIIVGSRCDREAGTIAGAKVDGVLAKLKARVRDAIERGEEVLIDVRLPE